MNSHFPQYTTDYISGVMSLRKPQEQSLKILEEIMTSITVKKGMNLKVSLGGVHSIRYVQTLSAILCLLPLLLLRVLVRQGLWGHLLPTFTHSIILKISLL